MSHRWLDDGGKGGMLGEHVWHDEYCTHGRQLIDAGNAHELREQAQGEYRVRTARVAVFAEANETLSHMTRHEREQR